MIRGSSSFSFLHFFK